MLIESPLSVEKKMALFQKKISPLPPHTPQKKTKSKLFTFLFRGFIFGKDEKMKKKKKKTFHEFFHE